MADPMFTRPNQKKPATKELTLDEALGNLSRRSAQAAPTADQGRTWGETASDFGVALTRGATNLAGSIASAADLATGGRIDKYVVKPLQGVADELAGGTGRAPGLAQAYEQANQDLSAKESPTLQRKKRELDETDGALAKAGKVLTDPQLLASMATEQVPNLATLGVGTAGTAAAKGTQLLGQGLTRKAAQEGAKKAAERQIIGASAAMGGGAAGQSAEQEALARGASPEEAKRAGMIAGGIAAPLSAAASAITAPLETSIFTRSMTPGLFSRQGAAQVATGTVKEAGEEALQEGSEQFAQNVGLQQTVSPDQALFEGVPEAAALGGTLGAVIGGPLTAGGVYAGRGADGALPAAQPDSVQQFEQAMQGQPAAEPEPLGITGTTADFVGAPGEAPRSMRPDAEFSAPPAKAAPAVPYPNAAPGSLSGAANAIAAAGAAAQTSEAINTRRPEPVANDDESVMDAIMVQFRAGNMIDSGIIASSFKIDKKKAAALRKEARTRLLAERESQSTGGQPTAEAIAPTGDTTEEAGALPGGVTTSTNTDASPMPAAAGATQETTDVRQGTERQERQDLSAQGQGQEEVAPTRARAREELFPRIETTVLPSGDRIVRGDPNRIREVVARSGSKNMGQLVREGGQIVGVRFSEGAFRRAEPAIADENSRIEQAASSMPAANEPMPAQEPVAAQADEPPAAVSAQNIVQPPEAPEPEATPEPAAPVAAQPVQAEESTEIQDDDITTPSGEPFTVRDAADLAARRAGPEARVVPVEGGFVVRTTTPTDVAPKAESDADRMARIRSTPSAERSQEDVDWMNGVTRRAAMEKAEISEAESKASRESDPIVRFSSTRKTPALSSRAENALRKQVKVGDKFMPRSEFIKGLVDDGFTVGEVDGQPALVKGTQHILQKDATSFGVQYAGYLIEQKSSERQPERRTDTESRAKVDALPVDERDAEIERLRAQTAELQRQLDYDAKTGTKSTAAYERDAPTKKKPSDRFKGVAFIDLIAFKGYNTKFTETGGDKILKAFGTAMVEVAGEGAYRRGGDEFAFLSEVSPEHARELATRLQDVLAKVTIEVADKDGNAYEVQGIPFRFGVGVDDDAAVNDSAARKQEGDREQNPNVRRKPSDQDDVGQAPAGPDGRGEGVEPDAAAEVAEAAPAEEAKSTTEGTNVDQYGQDIDALNARAEAWKDRIDEMDQDAIDRLYAAMDLAGDKRLRTQGKREILKAEHPDDLDSGSAKANEAALAESTPQPAPVTAPIEDAGEQLVWNRKGMFRGGGLTWDSIASENDALKVKLATKEKVWARPDWEALVNAVPADRRKGFTMIAHLVKQVYDRVPTKPKASTDDSIRSYIAAVTELREAADALLNSREQQGALAQAFADRLSKRQARGVIDIMSLADNSGREQMHQLFFKLFPDWARTRRLERGSAEQEKARQLGKAVSTMQFGSDELTAAVKAIADNWPAKQEAWQRQGYRVFDGSKLDLDFYESSRANNQYVYVYLTADENGKRVSVVSERIDGATSKDDPRVQAFAKSEAEAYRSRFVVLDKNNRMVGFGSSQEEAENIARERTKREGRAGTDQESDDGPWIREGVERRTAGENITSDRLKDAFGFRGVNFGKYVNQQQRQDFLNAGYDALHDLAEALNIPPNALSLNGVLGIAFGAQGRGGKNAAHFVPGVNEINLTRDAGAGALAHEWAHALDHYFGVKAGLARSGNPYASHIGSRAGAGAEIRPEIAEAFKSVVGMMQSAKETKEQATKRAQDGLKAATDRFGSYLDRYGVREKLAGNDKALAALDALERGDGGEYVSWPPAKGKRKSPGAVTESVKVIADALGLDFVGANRLHTESIPIRFYKQEIADGVRLRDIHTDFYAKSLARDGKDRAAKSGKDYWSTPHEMFARAFESFIMDRLADQGARNDFLVRVGKRDRETTNPDYPYPAGIERKAFNEAFGKLVGEFKVREEGGRSVLFSKGQPSDQTNTPEFRRWFGDSKVVDANGDPLVVYHGTPEVTRVSPRKVKPSKAKQRAREEAVEWLTRAAKEHGIREWSSVASIFENWQNIGIAQERGVTTGMVAKARQMMDANYAGNARWTQGRTDLGFDVFDMPGNGFELGSHFGTKMQAEAFGDAFPFYLAISNPIRLDDLGTWNYQSVIREVRRQGVAISEAEYDAVFNAVDNNEALRGLLLSKGIDGVVYANKAEGRGDSYIAFRPEQIKSATGNRGTFDPNDPSILRSRDNERAAIASPARLAAEVKRITAKWAAGAPKVEVLADHASAPDFLRNSQGFDDQVNAAIYRGTIYLFANRMGTVDKLRKTLAHEAVGHFSMETMLGPELFEWLTGKLNAARSDAALADLFAEVENRYGRNLDPGTFAREAIAVMAERGIKPGWVDRVLGAIRAFLRRMGFDLQLSRGDLIRLLNQAGRYIEGAQDARAQAQAQLGQATAAGGGQAQAEAFSMGDGALVAPDDGGIEVADEPVIDDAFVAGLTDSEMENPAVVTLAGQLYDAYGVFSPFVQRWLGKSKAVTDAGATGMRVPITLYHGTNRANLQAFDRRFLGGTNAAASGLGFFVTPEKSVAEQYGENVLTLYARIENPYEMSTAEFDTFETANDAQIRAEELRAEGFDGVYLPDQDFWVAFEPNQFKAADQRGTFDRTAGLFRSRQAVTFYSALVSAIETGKGAPKKADPGAWSQWLDGAQRRGEFRQSERDWMGVDAWLEQQAGPVTREALADFVRSNEVQVQEVVLGGPSSTQMLSRQREIAESLEFDHGVAIYDDTEGGFYLQRMDGGGRVERDSLSDEAESLLREWESLNAETGGGTKFSDPKYRLPGGENYRELLLTLPIAAGDPLAGKSRDELGRLYEAEIGYNPIEDDANITTEDLRQMVRDLGPAAADAGTSVGTAISGGAFQSSHWAQPNVLAHVRFDERTDADGKRVLFINEIQSDWHQEGRKKGYKGSGPSAEQVAEAKRSFDESAARGENAGDWRRNNPQHAAILQDSFRDDGAVPNAPLKATDEWAMAAFKRMARWAVDHGFDRVGWVTGEQAADFFDLSKEVGKIVWTSDGTLTAYRDADGGLGSANKVFVKDGVSGEKLSDYIGKEAADRLIKRPTAKQRLHDMDIHVLSGDDLKVGGEGMRGFYDKILPAAVGKWAKKFGVKVGAARLTAGEKSLANFASYADFKAAKNPEVTAHSIDITPAMREAVAGGQPLFSKDAKAVFDDIEKASKPAPDSVVKKIADWFSGLSGRALRENLRPTWLGALTLRHLGELGKQYLPEVAGYADVVQEMATDRNVMQEAAGKRAEEWEKLARKNRAQADALARVMHDSTLDGVDPSEEFVRGKFKHAMLPKDVAPLGVLELSARQVDEALRQIRARMRGAPDSRKEADRKLIAMIESAAKDERRRVAAYPDLVNRFNAMPKEFRDMYRAVRDDYRAQVKAVEDALVERIMAMEGSARDKAAMVTRLREEFESNRLQGPYFPLARFGDFWIAHKDPETDQDVYSMFETEGEWDQARKALKAAKVEIKAAGRKIDTARMADGVSSSFMSDLETMLKDAGISEKVQDDVWQLYLRTMPSLSLRKRFIHRKGTAGYSNDALRAYAGNAFHASFQIARLRHTHKLDSALAAMTSRNKEQSKDVDSDDAIKSAALINEMKKRHEWVMNPRDSAAANVASSVGFAWYLGVTPAAAFTNLTQTAIISFPVLAAKFGSVKAMNQLLRAFRQAAGSVTGDIKKTLTSDQERDAFRAWEAAGYVDKTLAHNLAGISETDSSSYSPAYRNTMNWVAMLFHKAEVLNRETTLLAAYRMAVADGMSHVDAVRYAGEVTIETHYDYSGANRARFMQSGAAKVLLMFRQYSLNTTWFLLRNAYLSMKGASPQERTQARRKLVGVLGMTGMFAGALGLPMMGVMFSLVNAAHAAFGDDDDEPFDAETEFRNFLADMLGAEPARWITQGPIEGLTGVEISSRTGLNELWFRDPNRELEGRELATYWLEQAAGPVAGIGLNAFVGLDMVNDGQVMRGIEAMSPKAVKDGLRALRYTTEGANTLRGDPIIEDLSLPETIMQLAGFSPARLNDRYDANAAVKNFESRLLKRRQALLDAYAMAVRLEDRDEIIAVSKRVAEWNQSQPALQINRGTLRRSLAQRMRYSERAESGIVVDRRIQREAMEQGRFAG